MFSHLGARWRSLAAAVAAVTLLAAPAQAVTLVGVFGGNDPFGGQQKGLYGTFGNYKIASPSLAKCDVPESSLSCHWENGGVAGEDYTSAFSVEFNGGKSGTWSFTPEAGLTHSPAYLAVKASTSWALYALHDASGGSWSTADITNPGGRQPDVSHLSFYNSVAPIPLPAAGWLLVAGLGGLAVARGRAERG